MGIKLIGASLSTCTRRVAVVLKELDVPYELVPVDLGKGEHKSPTYLVTQPFGQIPVLDDDGFKLFESRAIARYLAAKAGSPLIPTDAKKRALFEQAASIEQNNFDPYASAIAVEKIFKPVFFNVPGDDAKAAADLKTLETKLDAYDVILSKQKYLAGDELTLADLFHLPYGDIVDQKLKYDALKSRPNVARWWNDISSRPSWLAVKDGA